MEGGCGGFLFSSPEPLFFTSRRSVALLPVFWLRGGCGMALPRLLARALHRAASAAAPAAPGEEGALVSSPRDLGSFSPGIQVRVVHTVD